MKNSILIRGVVLLMTTFLYSSENKSYLFSPLDREIVEQKKNQVMLKIMSYNIHHANPPSSPDIIDIDAIVKTIEEQDPDIVALQEIDAHTTRSGEGNQGEIIAEKLGMKVFFAKAIDYDGGAYGVAILSKYPISEEKIYRLPTAPGTNGEQRVLATVKVALPNNIFIRFGSTHMDSQKEDTNRLLQIKEIADIGSVEKLPLIIAGDFNATPNSEVINILDKHFSRSCTNCAPTIPVQNPVRAIDFIAFKPTDYFSIVNHEVVNETYASDHLPVVAVLKINKQTK